MSKVFLVEKKVETLQKIEEKKLRKSFVNSSKTILKREKSVKKGGGKAEKKCKQKLKKKLKKS